MRRTLWMLGIAAFFLLVAMSVSAAPSQKQLDVTKLAEGVYALVWPDPLADPVEANVLVVVNDDDVLLVDSQFMPADARRIVAEVRKLTTKPVRYVVNTHWHNDHVQSNQIYREAWPQVQFISHTNTRRDSEKYAFGKIAKDVEESKATLERAQRWLKEGKDDSGKPIDEARRARIERVIPILQAYQTDVVGLHSTVADITFDDALVLHRGSRTIELRYLGRGNTRGDIVVFLPKEKIVATGDLVVHPSPFGFGSYYKEWIATLGKVAALDANAFVPGHGPVMRDRKYIESLQGVLTALTTEVDAAIARGATLDETKKSVTLDQWRVKFAANDPQLIRAFNEFFLAPAVERAWRQAKGEPGAFEQDV